MSTTGARESLVFGVADYLSLSIVLCISVLIGLYYSVMRKNTTTEEYLFGNRKLKILPVALSIMASRVSTMNIVTTPTEIYFHGLDFAYVLLSNAAAHIIVYVIFLPFFQEIKISTVYEYLNLRFNGTVRIICSALFTLSVVAQIPIQISVCSQAISQVSGMNFYASAIAFGMMTTFYTTIGGIRAVVWTDVLQAVFMFAGVTTLAIIGTMDVGDLGLIWNKNYESGRLKPPMLTLDFMQLYSLWSWILGDTFGCIVRFYFNQGIFQRFLSLPTLQDAKRCHIISSIVFYLITSIDVYIGMLLVATFVDCDPLKSNQVTGKDQITPLYIMRTLRNYQGIPGLMIAAIVSAALSTVSTQLNSIAAIVLYDYYKPYAIKNQSEKCSNFVLKIAVVVLGTVATACSLFIRKLGTALQVLVALIGTLNGSILGIIVIGMFIPSLKSKATFLGSLVGFVVTAWISLNMNIAVASGDFRFKTKEIYTDGCTNNFTTANPMRHGREISKIYQISTLWYSLIGFLVTLFTANILNLFMERNDPRKMDRILFSPFIHRFYPLRIKNTPENEMCLLNSIELNKRETKSH